MKSFLDIYFALPVWAQHLAISLYGAHLRIKRYGGAHDRLLQALASNELMDWDEMQKHQEKLLYDVLHYAVKRVPYYSEHHGDLPATVSDSVRALRTWPILEKSDVQMAGSSLIATGFRSRRLTEIHTGGTTGRALSVWADNEALRANYAFFERFKSWTGIHRGSRVATFAGRALISPNASRPPYWRYNFASRQMLCSSYHLSPNTVDDYILGLEQFNPSLIDSYPSSIEPIARAILARGGTSLRLEAVITSSETLVPDVRALISKAFSCPVFDHYGSAEMVAFVTQCEAGSLHPNSDFGYLEVLASNGDPVEANMTGEIVATGFVNRVMPLIRYRMGDEVTSSDQRCACGRSFPMLSELRGRVDDVIVTPDGRRVGRIDPIFKSVASLHEARVVQTDLDALRLELVVGATFTDSDRDELVRQLLMRVGSGMRIHVERVKAIPRSPGGKLRTVVSSFALKSTRVRANDLP